MALFKPRKGRDEPPVPAAPAQTVEAMRRRAMHRLIGAAILVLAGVIGFPLFFDNQPRPIAVDLPIVIPDKAKVPALVVPVVTAGALVTPAADADAAPAKSSGAPAPVSVEPAPTPVAVAKPPPEPPATPKPSIDRAADAGKARDLLEGKDPGGAKSTGVADGRFIVQVGAFSDADKVREVRRKVEGLGLKTYTQVVETKEGSRTRVRVGPFADKAEATRTADKIRKLGVAASILSL